MRHSAMLVVPIILQILNGVSRAESVGTCIETRALRCNCMQPASPAKFKVLYPNGGETLRAGATDTLWFCVAPSEDTVFAATATVEFSYDNKMTWTFLQLLTIDDIPHARVFTVPDTAGARCFLKVSVYADLGDPATEFDISDRGFTIMKADMRVRSAVEPVSRAMRTHYFSFFTHQPQGKPGWRHCLNGRLITGKCGVNYSKVPEMTTPF